MALNRTTGPRDEMREQRRVITALFADTVGSTALGERLDPEDYRDIVGAALPG
jgi:class 3 adenylate cyclase